MDDGAAGFDAFVHASGPRLLRAAWLLTGDWHSAEDLLQTALTKVWPRWSGLHDDAHRMAYTRRVLMTSYLRGARRRWTGELATDEIPEPPDTRADDDGVLLRDCLRSAARRLPPKQRACVALRYFLDLSESETAAALGTSVGAVKSNTARALQRLRRDPSLADLLTEEHQP